MFKLILLPAIVLGCLPVTDAVKPPEELDLKSSYSVQFLVEGARQIRVQLKINERGNGTGTVELDPNIKDGWSSTCIAIPSILVEVQLIEDDPHNTKGRRLYVLKEIREELQVKYPPKFYLIRPTKAGLPMTLVFLDDKGGFRDAIVLN